MYKVKADLLFNGKDQVYTVDEWISQLIEYAWDEGEIETMKARTEKVGALLGRITAKLVAKGILNEKDLQEMSFDEDLKLVKEEEEEDE
jgi:hypothetical protein